MGKDRAIAPADLKLAQKLARQLSKRYPQRIQSVTVFGSRARGEANEESDLDLFVALKDDDESGEIKALARGIACDLTLESGCTVSVFVAGETFLKQRKGFVFLKEIEKEGIPV